MEHVLMLLQKELSEADGWIGEYSYRMGNSKLDKGYYVSRLEYCIEMKQQLEQAIKMIKENS